MARGCYPNFAPPSSDFYCCDHAAVSYNFGTSNCACLTKKQRRLKIQPGALSYQFQKQHNRAYVDSPCYSSCSSISSSSISSSDTSSSGYEDNEEEYYNNVYDEGSFWENCPLVPRKVFVGGLDTDYPEADIRAYFEKYGKIESVELVYDKYSYERRRFCFITFETEDGWEAACKQSRQKIGKKECGVRKAYDDKGRRMAGRSYPVGCRLAPKKVFVGGLDKDYPKADIIAYFEKYGEVHSVGLPYNTTKNERREFCFINFETEEGWEAACKQSKQKIGNRECDVRKAYDDKDRRMARRSYQAPSESSDEESSAEESCKAIDEESSDESLDSEDNSQNIKRNSLSLADWDTEIRNP